MRLLTVSSLCGVALFFAANAGAQAPINAEIVAPKATPGSTAPAVAPASATSQPVATPAVVTVPKVVRLAPTPEKNCTDGKDNDKDSVVDCADNDCRTAPSCQPDGNAESTEARCSDWVDNDEDGVIDCDDADCDAMATCKGSWKAPKALANAADASDGGEVPELGAGMAVQDLIGTGKDIDGERNDYLCADGIDNDGDGAVDCADFGCRFDDSVTVCRGTPGMRFSVVGMMSHSYDIEEEKNDSRVRRLQLRTFGPIPGISDSFFLISLSTERTPRLSFAMFQIPLGNSQHRLAVNSGAAGLSQVNAISIHKQLFIDRPNLFRAMEQFNSAAFELTGPLTVDGRLQYRTFAAGGNGRFDGNVGGRSVVDNDANYPFGAGGSIQFNAAGFYSRFDTPFLYVPVPLTAAVILGAKYDEREQERFASVNLHAVVRWQRFIVLLENYFKREFEFESDTNAFVGQLGFLAWPKHIMLAAEYGFVSAGEFGNPPPSITGALRSQRDERQIRFAGHWYFYRNIGVLSVVFRDDVIPEQDFLDEVRERSIEFVGQYRF